MKGMMYPIFRATLNIFFPLSKKIPNAVSK